MRDSHMHTPFCRHAVGTPDEYAASAIERENPLDGITFTCHCPPFEFPNGLTTDFNRMGSCDYPDYVAEVKQTAKRYAGKLDVLLGLEVDYIPYEKAISQLQSYIKQFPLDWVLGSIHPYRDYQEVYCERAEISPRNWLDVQARYFDHLAMAAEETMSDGKPMFDVLSHPDLIKCFLPNEWYPQGVLKEIINPALDRIAATGVAMEINTSGTFKPPYEIHPSSYILEEMAKRSIPIVLGSDAHSPNRVGADFDKALLLAANAGFQEIIVPIGGRKYEAISISEAANRLRLNL